MLPTKEEEEVATGETAETADAAIETRTEAAGGGGAAAAAGGEERVAAAVREATGGKTGAAVIVIGTCNLVTLPRTLIAVKQLQQTTSFLRIRVEMEG